MGSLRTTDFVEFRDALRPLYETLRGEAVFDTMEDWLKLQVKGDGLGHFDASCELMDVPGMVNKVRFSLKFDQTELPEILRGLGEVIEAFPVVGKP